MNNNLSPVQGAVMCKLWNFLQIFKLASRNYRPQENILCLKSIERNLVKSEKDVLEPFLQLWLDFWEAVWEG